MGEKFKVHLMNRQILFWSLVFTLAPIKNDLWHAFRRMGCKNEFHKMKSERLSTVNWTAGKILERQKCLQSCNTVNETMRTDATVIIGDLSICPWERQMRTIGDEEKKTSDLFDDA